jgi:small-conductance mechanosensitive channel
MSAFLNPDQIDPTLYKWMEALSGIGLVYVLSRIARISAGRYVKDTHTRYRARKLVSFFGYLLGIGILAFIFSDQLRNLPLFVGVFGAGVAFALQEVIASAAGWVAVSFGRFYAPGDRIQLGGIVGDVIDIGILRTTLMECGEWVKSDLYNGRIVRVANSFVFKEPVYNYSADFPFLWDEIVIRVRYGSDWKYAKDVFSQVLTDVTREDVEQSHQAWTRAVRRYRLEEARIEPLVTMAMTDNWLEFTARYVVHYRKRRLLKDLLYSRIMEAVDQSDNRIRLASTTMEVVNLPRLDVRFDKGEGRMDPHYVP